MPLALVHCPLDLDTIESLHLSALLFISFDKVGLPAHPFRQLMPTIFPILTYHIF